MNTVPDRSRHKAPLPKKFCYKFSIIHLNTNFDLKGEVDEKCERFEPSECLICY